MAKANPGENFTVLRAVLPGGWVIKSALSCCTLCYTCTCAHGRPEWWAGHRLAAENASVASEG